ncbi:17973_t:CDS:2, partial [Gigaspora rosea]
GSQILLSFVGTDITNDFYKLHSNKIAEDIDCSESLIIPNDTTSKNYSSVLAKHMEHHRGRQISQKRMSVAKFIDNINLNEKVCGKGLVILGYGSTCQNIESKSVEIDTKNIKFHRYKLTSKKMVNANVKYPVMSFTFSKIHQDGKVYTGKSLLDITLRCNIEGLFSQHLNEQLIGYEIQALGPFDVCDRNKSYLASKIIEPLSPAQKKIIFSLTKLYTPYSRLIGALPTAKTSLLNPDSPDGCWDELYMIA